MTRGRVAHGLVTDLAGHIFAVQQNAVSRLDRPPDECWSRRQAFQFLSFVPSSSETAARRASVRRRGTWPRFKVQQAEMLRQAAGDSAFPAPEGPSIAITILRSRGISFKVLSPRLIRILAPALGRALPPPTRLPLSPFVVASNDGLRSLPRWNYRGRRDGARIGCALRVVHGQRASFSRSACAVTCTVEQACAAISCHWLACAFGTVVVDHCANPCRRRGLGRLGSSIAMDGTGTVPATMRMCAISRSRTGTNPARLALADASRSIRCAMCIVGWTCAVCGTWATRWLCSRR